MAKNHRWLSVGVNQEYRTEGKLTAFLIAAKEAGSRACGFLLAFPIRSTSVTGLWSTYKSWRMAYDIIWRRTVLPIRALELPDWLLSDFNALVDYIAASGLPVDTVGNVVRNAP